MKLKMLKKLLISIGITVLAIFIPYYMVIWLAPFFHGKSYVDASSKAAVWGVGISCICFVIGVIIFLKSWIEWIKN